LFPGNVVQGHGVGDGAVHVEEVGAVGAWWQNELHKDRV
jgi:hypothetical protein